MPWFRPKMPDYARIGVGAARASLSVMRSNARAPELIDRLVDIAHELAHSVNDQLQAEGDPQRLHLPVCKEGCAWCCYADVGATPPELLRIVRHLRATRTPEELTTLRTRLEELAARTRDMTSQDWKRERIACPLLDGATSACTIHEVRPMACRAYNSVDVTPCIRQCETGDENIAVPANTVQQRSMLAVGIGLATACRLHDLEWEWIGLTAGLAAALSVPDADERWLAGERPFKDAHTKATNLVAPRNASDVDATLRRVRESHADELPPATAAAPSDDEARRERNRRKRQRKGR